jgi:hypothetical protein
MATHTAAVIFSHSCAAVTIATRKGVELGPLAHF